MFCSKCGKEISDDSKFCSACGQAFSPKENKSKIHVIIGIGILFLFLTVSPLLTNSSSSVIDTKQEKEILMLADSFEDFLVTHEATGLIITRKIEGDNYTIIINEDLWLNSMLGHDRNLVRYAVKRVAESKGLNSKIIGNNTKQNYQI